METTNVIVQVPKEDHREFKSLCAQKGRSMAEVLREYIVAASSGSVLISAADEMKKKAG